MYDRMDLLHLFQRCKRGYEAALAPVEAAFSLTRNEIDVLLFLSNNPEYDTARDVVELRALSKSHVCKSVDRLTRRGYLSGAQDRRDRRLIHLRILPAAGEAVAAARQAQQDFFLTLYRGVPPEDRRVLERVMRQIAANLSGV